MTFWWAPRADESALHQWNSPGDDGFVVAAFIDVLLLQMHLELNGTSAGFTLSAGWTVVSLLMITELSADTFWCDNLANCHKETMTTAATKDPSCTFLEQHLTGFIIFNWNVPHWQVCHRNWADPRILYLEKAKGATLNVVISLWHTYFMLIRHDNLIWIFLVFQIVQYLYHNFRFEISL